MLPAETAISGSDTLQACSALRPPIDDDIKTCVPIGSHSARMASSCCRCWCVLRSPLIPAWSCRRSGLQLSRCHCCRTPVLCSIDLLCTLQFKAASSGNDESVPSVLDGRAIANQLQEFKRIIIQSQARDPHMHAGCTAIVALKCGNTLYVANAGDSRGVLCRAGAIFIIAAQDVSSKPMLTVLVNGTR